MQLTLENMCKRYGIDLDAVRRCDVLVLPDCVIDSNDEPLETRDSIQLSKVLKSQGINCKTMFDLGLECRMLERRGDELWLGALWIVSNIAVPVVVSVFSNFLTDWVKNSKVKESTTESVFVVHVHLVIQTDRDVKRLDFNGDVNQLLKALEGLKHGNEHGDRSGNSE